jgi:uncharacterized protein YecT (DUF1311 family)
MRSYTLAFAMACLCLAGAAEAPKLSAGYDQCLDKADGVTLAIRRCIAAEHEIQDRKLNAAYETLMAQEPERRAELRAAQRAWTLYRKTECSWRGAAFRGGTAEPMTIDDCWLTMTAMRARDLADEVEVEKDGR